MSIFDWSDRFSVYITKMDEQHKKLIGLLNEFHDAKLAGKDEEVMRKLLNDLLDYTKKHFKKEEELMSQYQYPQYDAHKSLHIVLAEKVETLQKKFLSGGKASIYGEMAILLNDWLTDHIIIEDKKYGIFINSGRISV